MPLEPLVEAAGSVLADAAGAAFATVPKSRRRRWGPVWLAAFVALVLLFAVELPASLLLAAACLALGDGLGRLWQWAYRRRRLARMRRSTRDSAALPRELPKRS